MALPYVTVPAGTVGEELYAKAPLSNLETGLFKRCAVMWPRGQPFTVSVAATEQKWEHLWPVPWGLFP